MGAYLSSPITDKISCDQTCAGYSYGASSMQGWRISQEDAHNCLPDFDEETRTALFAVYDGHGGAEVAQYSAIHLPDCIKQTESYKSSRLGQALIDAFLKLDSRLVEESVIKELKELAGEDEEEDEDDDDDPVGRGEADVLRAEADIPLDQILAKYKTSGGFYKKDVFHSPLVQTKQQGQEEKARSSPGNSNASNSPSCSGSISSESSSSLSVKLTPDFSDSLINGHAENENNLNKEKELQNNFQAVEGNLVGNSDSGVSCSDGKLPLDTVGITDNSSDTRSFAGTVKSANGDKDSVELSVTDDGEDSVVLPYDASVSNEACSTLMSSGTVTEASCTSSTAVEKPGSSSSGSSLGESSGSSAEQIGNQEEPGPSGSGCIGHGHSGSSNKSSLEAADIEMEDESDDDEEEEWEEDSDEDEDEEEEEEEADEMCEGVEPMMDMSNEEPGSDSGCTACVALIRKNQLVVANAGDSRCVVSRSGKAVDLSFDHKPEDEAERLRIEKAGGKVTADGRVNGGLNLSRAIGDHFYKRKEGLPPEEQMITAFPDVQTLTLEPDIEFMVLACDGIWNYMSSQEVVAFVAERLKDPAKSQKLSIICEEMFDHCLAPNTCGDGTGCDNMTCIIVVFDSQMLAGGDWVPPNKRCVNDLETSVQNVEKRIRVDESTDNKDESLNISCADDKAD